MRSRKLKGNRSFTSLTRELSAAAMIQKHVNLARGDMNLSEKLRERLVHAPRGRRSGHRAALREVLNYRALTDGEGY